MFLKTLLLSGSVPSGSTADGEINDFSSYNKLWVQAWAGNGVAGTASIAITSVDDSDTNPVSGIVGQPSIGSGATLVTLVLPENTWVTSSVLSINTKWGAASFEATSGSTNTTTGSVIIKASLQNW